jgi:predicted ATPase/DNA-binding SARP family transcriptional activator/Tfp pilus assembly protein PilF
VDFRLLGPLEVYDGGEALRLGSPKQRALLALLLLRANEVVSREAAIDALWPDDPPERAAQSLQVYVHGLRKALGHERIELRGTGYVLHVEQSELDLQRFDRLIGLERFDEAFELWRGEPLADIALDCPERAGLAELRLRAHELDAEARLAAGEHDDLIPRLEALVAEQPLREPFRRQLMLALYRAGRQADALEVFRATRKLLADELGLDPGPALSELERAILRQDPSLQAPAQQPKLRLPAPATSFVGRHLDIAAVSAQLREETRLLTLTGPGGIGKTRLAIEAAAELGAQFADGAFFVDLAPTVDPAHVAATIAATVVVGDTQGRSPLEAVTSRLRPLEAVLVLDNFERLLAAAPVVAHLVEHAPRLRVLVTSRAPLHLGAEREYAVQPIDVIEDAAAIFVARARVADPTFELTDENRDAVERICQTLEGLPLALELAAARVRLLTPQQLLARLAEPLAVLTGGGRDVPARQQTLRATIDWSYELLDRDAQRLFPKLAVFAGGCTLEAAERICAAHLDPLSALLDNSLLRREQPVTGAPRFRMLDTVREYALELDGGTVRERHAEYFTELAERIGQILVGPRRVDAVRELVGEHENLRAALAYSLAHDVDLGFRIAAALRLYWTTAGRGREIRAWLERALQRNEALDTRARVGARLVLGRQVMNDGEYSEARAILEQVTRAARSLGCWGEASVALGYLAWLATAAGEEERTRSLAEEAVELGRRADDLWAERQGLAMIAATLINRGDYEDARAYLDRALALARELDDPSTIVLALGNSSYGAIAAGDLGAARRQLQEAVELSRRLDEPPSTVSVLYLLAWAASLAGEPDRARACLREALELLRAGGRRSHIVDVLSETAIALEATDPEAAARILAAAESGAPARGAPGRLRYEALRARLAPSPAALTPDEAVAVALDALGEPQGGPHGSPDALRRESGEREEQERQHGQDEVEAPPHR